MNKKIISASVSAALCMSLAVSAAPVSFAAYIGNSAAALSVTAGVDLISADGGFSSDMEGWTVTGGDADVSDGAVNVTADGSAALTTDIGAGVYKSASGKDLVSWDFETDDDIASDVDLNKESDIGRWTSARASTPYYTETQDMVEPYNKQYKEEGGTASVVINWQDGVSELLPPEGSERCLTIFNPKNKAWTDYMGIRVRLSDKVLRVGETYTLSFWMMESSHRRAIYCGRTPYADNELSVNTDSELKNGVLDYQDNTHNLVMDKTIKQWAKYSTTFVPAAEEFNEEGYTTLWIITTGKYKPGTANLSNRNNIYIYEKFYFDNISLEREIDGVKTTNYHFGAKVKGEAGKSITAKAEIDGTDKVFEVTKTFENTDEWESLTSDFSISSDIPYLSGSEKGSCFASDNPRIKLSVSADGSFSADDIHIIENIEGGDTGRYSGQPILLAAEVMGYDNIDDVTAVCRADGITVFEEPAALAKGINAFSFAGEIPSGAGGLMTFDMIKDGSSIFDKQNIVTKFYKNGTNVYPSIEALKSFGAGQYLVEFDVAGAARGDTAEVSIGGVSETADVFPDGTGVAEIHLTDEDIEGLSGTDEITVSSPETVSNITVKKISNAVKQ